MSQSFYSADNELPAKLAALDTAAQITLTNQDTLFYMTYISKALAISKKENDLTSMV